MFFILFSTLSERWLFILIFDCNISRLLVNQYGTAYRKFPWYLCTCELIKAVYAE